MKGEGNGTRVKDEVTSDKGEDLKYRQIATAAVDRRDLRSGTAYLLLVPCYLSLVPLFPCYLLHCPLPLVLYPFLSDHFLA